MADYVKQGARQGRAGQGRAGQCQAASGAMSEGPSFLSWPDHVGSHSSGGKSTGRAPCREGSHRPRMNFVSIVAQSCPVPGGFRSHVGRDAFVDKGPSFPSWPNHVRSHSNHSVVEGRPEGHLVGKCFSIEWNLISQPDFRSAFHLLSPQQLSSAAQPIYFMAAGPEL